VPARAAASHAVEPDPVVQPAEPTSIFIREGGGVVIEQDLPLPENIADRLRTGALTRVHANGDMWQEGDTE
jgi:hypothetical protein